MYNGVDGFWRVEWRGCTTGEWYLQALAHDADEAAVKLVVSKFEDPHVTFRIKDPQGNVVEE